MKKAIVAGILLALWVALLPGKSLAAAAEADSSLVKGEKIMARVDGLSCPFCAYGLEKKLKKLDGVKKIQIRVNDGVAVLYLKKEAAVRKREIRRLIKEAGFTPREIVVAGTDSKKGRSAATLLNVTGITCNDCIEKVKAAIKNSPCAEIQRVDLEKKEAVLTCRGTEAEREEVVKAIEKMGFGVQVAAAKERK